MANLRAAIIQNELKKLRNKSKAVETVIRLRIAKNNPFDKMII